MRILLFVCMLLGFVKQTAAQSLFIAGPMPGYTELRSTRIWTEVHTSVDELLLNYHAKDEKEIKHIIYDGSLHQNYNTVVFTIPDLEPGATYEYEILAKGNGITEKQYGQVTTQELWQWRKSAPDFSFITGSCAYINQALYDRPGKPYGGDSFIFHMMAGEDADFMLWLGDNWYTREADYFSASGLKYRAHHDRSTKILQPLLKAMPHYAIWDDHDYGPNDFSMSYILKDESRKVFMDYWVNPSYGMDGKGIYTQFTHNDVAFFLLDDRTWRSNDQFKDSMAHKQMFGPEQMQWLKDALLSNRNATFKIIASGSQMLNPASPYNCFTHYKAEYTDLMNFLKEYEISGVVFLTGDRHHSEIIKINRDGTYPLYDITISPLTAHAYSPSSVEKDMKERVEGTLVAEQNFANVTIAGGKGERNLTVQVKDINGKEKVKWTVSENDLKISR